MGLVRGGPPYSRFLSRFLLATSLVRETGLMPRYPKGGRKLGPYRPIRIGDSRDIIRNLGGQITDYWPVIAGGALAAATDAASRFRGWGSQTRTKEKNKIQHIRGLGIPGTVSSWYIGKDYPKWAENQGFFDNQPQRWYADFKGVIDSDANTQEVGELASGFLDYNDLAYGITTAGETHHTGSLSDNNSFANVRCLMEKFSGKLFISNTCNFPINITLYLVRAKRSMASLEVTNYEKPFSDFFARGIDDVNVSYTTITAGRIGITPGFSPMFKDSWEIEKKTKVKLGVGQDHEHSFNVYVNKVYRGNELRGKNSGDGVPGWTYWICYILHGITANDGTAGGSVGIARAQFSYTGYVNYKCRKMVYDVATHTGTSTVFDAIADAERWGEDGDKDEYSEQ